MGSSIVDTERELYLLGKSMKGTIPVGKAAIAVNLTLSKTLGPFYKLYRNLSAAVTTLGEVMKHALNPIKAVGVIFGGMRDNIFFLIGIIALAAAGFAALAGEFGGVTGLADGFKESLSSLGITSDSIKESFDLFVEGLKIGFDALVMAWGALVTNMSETGFIDSLIGIFEGFKAGAEAAFAGISEAMGILGVDGGNLGETLTGLIDGVFAFLDSVGFIEYFNEFMATVALFGEAFGVVFGAIMVWIAKVIKKATTEGTMLNKFVKGIVWAITGVFKIWFGFVKLGLKGIQAIFKGVIWFAKNGFSGLKDAIVGKFKDILDKAGAEAAFAGISEAMGILGVDGGNLGETLTGIIDGLFAFLDSIGFIEYFNELMATVALFGEAFGVVFGALMVWIAKVIKKATTEGTMLNKFVKAIMGGITIVFKIWFGFVKLVLKGIQAYFKAVIWFAENGFSGLKDAIVGKFKDILDKAGEWKNKISDKLGGMWDFIMSPIEWILDKIEELKNIDLGSLVPDLGDITGGLSSLNPFASGGISKGPQSGYPVALHGTEAVVPLPDGRSIPVTMQGGGGGGDFTANITINGGGGDASAIARAVGQEVQRAFRSRSRSGGYGRGV